MIDEDLLRDALAGLGAHPPLPDDRVGAVRRRIRRRARVRAAAAVVAASAVVTVGVLALPALDGGRDALPPARTPVEAGEPYRVTITQAFVQLPGTGYDAALARVTAAVDPLGLPGRTGRPAVDGTSADGRVRLDFVRRLTAPERGRLQAALGALPGAAVDLRDVDGFDLRLVAQLSDEVRARVLAEGALVPQTGPGPLADALRGLYGVEPDEQARTLTVTYSGPALTAEELATARREVARLAGADPDEVRLLRGDQRDSGFSYDLDD